MTAARRLVLAVVPAMLLRPGVTASPAASHTLSFRTEDGVTIVATLYEAPRRPAPAVILLHMLTRSREDWQPLADRLAEAGIHALAVDFRGHGGSGSGPAAADSEPDLSRLVLDARAARTYLASHPELVRASAIGIAGASLGASIAMLEAAADPSIRSLALLSPAMDYRSLRAEPAMRKYGPRPALLIAASNDPYALRSVKQIVALGGGVRDARTLDSAGHGTAMFARDPELARILVDWFERTLL